MEEQREFDVTQKTGWNTGSVEMHSRVAEALSKLSVCVRSVGLYGRFHPMIEDLVVTAHQAVTNLLLTQPKVMVVATDSCLVMDSFPIEDNSGSLVSIAKSMRERNVGELTLTAGLTQDEMTEFAEALSLEPDKLKLLGGIAMELRRRNVTHVEVRSGALPVEFREGKDPADIYEEALVLVEEAMRAVQSGLRIPVAEIRTAVADSLHSLIGDESALLALAGIRSYDRYLSEHSVNVCILSMILSRDIGLDAASTLELGISAMLHDVGKVFVPNSVVIKPGKLSEEEWEQIRRHPGEGARALAGLPDLPALAATIALEHHVYCDGTGYPPLPAQHKPHLLSRLVAVVDTYDALTTERPYRERWTPLQSIAWMMYEAPRRYDRELMARFAARARLYPIGALVRLVNGELAVVAGGNYKFPTRPKIRTVAGHDAGSAASKVIDLSTNKDPSLEIDKMAHPVEVLLPLTDKLLAA
ncbi:MAG: HD-GYP domain-containing protein [Armatimonadota bacterium]|nr:HD-GYP domain-containing protein [Armatimonadota bacterium]